MLLNPRKILPAGIFMGLVLTLTGGLIPAQQPPPLPPPNVPVAQPGQPDPNEPEVLARGAVHEAYAATAEMPTATPVVEQKPPEPIEELPPEQKPEGDNVQWIPGYWHWDDDDDRFIWISGFWRNTPPGRLWVAGSWREVRGGWQWVPGFWQEPQVEQPQQPELEYLPPPPETVEVGPSVAAPTTTSFYVPGSWVWRGRYVWRPGFYIEHRVNWVWVPAHFRWTPVGYVFVDGYWDYPLSTRGVLYAPVYIPRQVYAQPAYVYTPAYVVSEPAMVGALFVRRGWGGYYFGDYFGPRHTGLGFSAWCGNIGPRGGFAIGFNVGGGGWRYDPLWNYYSVAYRNTPAWGVGVGNLYGGRYRGDIARPPVNLVQQNTVINRITNVNVTNVTNNVTVVNKNVTVNNKNVTEVAMLAPAKVARDLHPESRIQPIAAEVRKREAQQAKEIRQVGAQRAKVETAAFAKMDPKAKNDAPRKLRIEVPEAAVQRAKVSVEKQAPPANPVRDGKAAAKVDPRINAKKDDPPPVIFTPRPELKVDPKDVKVDPKVNIPKDPKLDPKVIDPKDPKVDPKNPKVDPKNPKVDPKDPKDPKVDPKDPPKVDPIPKGKVDPPKVDPKDPKNPKVDPLPKGKVDPPKVDPIPKGKVDPPKVDPIPKGKVDPPKVDPIPKGKVDPPKVDPPPKLPPKVDPIPKGKVDPPKVDPPPKGKVDPPKFDPPPKGKVDPPKVDPIPKGKVDPIPKGKVDPIPKGKVDPPKVDPKEKGKEKDPPPAVADPMARSRPAVVPPVRPQVNPPAIRQPAKLPVVNPPAQPKPLAVPPRPPVVQPKQPVVQPKPQPVQPRPQVVQPRPPVAQPKPQPVQPRQPVVQPKADPRPRVQPKQPASQPRVAPQPKPTPKAPAANPKPKGKRG